MSLYISLCNNNNNNNNNDNHKFFLTGVIVISLSDVKFITAACFIT